MLNQRKAAVDPTMTPQNADSIRSPWIYAIIPNAPNASIKSPEASPSRPSVKFTEFEVATMMNMKSGIYHHPIVTSPIMGMFIESKPSFSKNQYAPTPPNIVSHMSLKDALNPFVLPIPLMFK